MLVGHTSGGSPIFYGSSRRKIKGKTFYKCSDNESHKLTKKQAESSGYMCSHCGAELKVRKVKLEEMKNLMKIFGLD